MKILSAAKILTIAMICAASVASISMAQTIIVPDFRVDDAAAGKLAGGPGLQRLLGNEFAVVWTDTRNPDRQIYASIYSFSGAVIRDDYRIDDGAPGSASTMTGSGATTIDSNGNFFVTWLNTVDLVQYSGRISKFLPNGDPDGTSVDANEIGSLPSQIIGIAKGNNDNLLISDIRGPSVYYRMFSNSLIPVTSSTQANQASISGLTTIASDYLGNFVVAWRGNLLTARLYDPDGNPRTNEFSIESSMSGADYPRAVYNKDGHFIVVWWSGTRYGMGRIMDGDGTPLSSVFYLGPAVAEPNERWGRPSVDADAAGNFIVAYEYSSDTSTKRIYGTIYGTNGDVIRQFFPISQPTSGLTPGVYMDTDVAYLSQGQFVTVWKDGRNGSDGDIYAAILKIDGWEGMTPIAGPGALALIIAGLGWIFRLRMRRAGARTSAGRIGMPRRRDA